jgi:exodeoxyribonuclease VII small subunit
MIDKKLTFEEALAKLESCADRISSRDITLEQAIEAYEEGASYYEQCDLIVKNAQQRIRQVGKDADDGFARGGSDALHGPEEG